MLKLPLHQNISGFCSPSPSLSHFVYKNSFHGFSHVYRDKTHVQYKPRRKGVVGGRGIARFNMISNVIRPSGDGKNESSVTIKAVFTARLSVGALLSKLTLNGVRDGVTELVGRALLVELVSSELDPETGLEKPRLKGYAQKQSKTGNELKLETKFDVPQSFGDVGAVLVQNQYLKEIYLKDIVLQGSSNNSTTITCNSWISSKSDNPQTRMFFTNKSYLPSQTPGGLKKLREEELENLRGDGSGERKSSDRIYDYDKYNDIGFPDLSSDLARPVLGGPQRPYPRRCRTGRNPSDKDPLSEKRSLNNYVPRDEAFSEEKQLQFTATTADQVLNGLLPAVPTTLVDSSLGFANFTDIDNIFDIGITIPKTQDQGLFRSLVSQLGTLISRKNDDIFRFDTPELFERDRFSWLKDEEFARQTLAGTNPYTIQLITEWPLMSKLDPSIYGPSESAITKELLERELKGITTVEEALEQKKLFMLDYHDLMMPYVEKVRALEHTTLYGSRTIFFLSENSRLKPIAIEFTRPPMGTQPQWKKVYTPGEDATTGWLWKLAKVHVLAHDSGIHELVSHWLRTHCCLEPYIIATNRQLSAMHPIYRLLHPHLRYTMQINALARQNLINAGGIIERSFSPGKYSMELSAVAYDLTWRFDMEALPKDLIRRGMAIEDSTTVHGLKLTIQDYPFASDGLLVWDALKQWITDYVNHYYPEPRLIETDVELQTWWTEIRTKGHEDKKDEPWWPVLETPDDLIQILTTIAWVASCHHAAVNFGQYDYGGYFPNRPSIARKNMINEDSSLEQEKRFTEKPESILVEYLPSQLQATLVIATLRLLSTHSTDEEYIGGQMAPSWVENPVVKEAFERFNKRLREVEGIIDGRNADPKLLNRRGVGVVPYELMKPFSKPGVTGMGVPNSTSI